MEEALWEFKPWFPSNLDMAKFYRDFKVLNAEEVYAAGILPGQIMPGVFPQIVIDFPRPDLNIDCFVWEGRVFFSEKLKDKFLACGASIQAFSTTPADHSCFKSKYYMINFTESDSIKIDAENLCNNDDVSQDRWFSEPGSLPTVFKFSKPVFVDKYYMGRVYCSDEFAKCVTKNGGSGYRFFEPNHADIDTVLRYLTPDGVVEEQPFA